MLVAWWKATVKGNSFRTKSATSGRLAKGNKNTTIDLDTALKWAAIKGIYRIITGIATIEGKCAGQLRR